VMERPSGALPDHQEVWASQDAYWETTDRESGIVCRSRQASLPELRGNNYAASRIGCFYPKFSAPQIKYWRP